MVKKEEIWSSWEELFIRKNKYQNKNQLIQTKFESEIAYKNICKSIKQNNFKKLYYYFYQI